MVAGGLTINGQRQSLPLDSVESLTLDIAGESWFQEAKLPNIIIGAVSFSFLLRAYICNNKKGISKKFQFKSYKQVLEMIVTKDLQELKTA